MSKARFITVEGGEGVGKSSFCSALIELLRPRVGKLVCTREPGGTQIADRIRQIFLLPPDGERLLPESELCLVSAARMQHVHHVIIPSIKNGEWVVCDRYADSTRVYQGELAGVGLEVVENFIRATTCGVQPDLTFLLDCATEVAQSRLQNRSQQAGEISRFDSAKAAHHQQIRSGFLRVAARFSERFVVIDASGTVTDAVDVAMQALKQRGWLG